MALLPDAGIETIEDKLKTVLKLRSHGNDGCAYLPPDNTNLRHIAA